VTALALLSACATTIDERAGTTTPTDDVTVAPLTVPSGTDDELLAQLLTAMTGLSALIGPAVGPAATDGTSRPDKEQRLVEIEAIWSAARPEVESVDALVARQIDGLVAMSRVAVERNRPADADKAARFLSDVVAAYTADGA
jgi:hypothetical protein